MSKGKVIVGVDTSGSIRPDEMDHFLQTISDLTSRAPDQASLKDWLNPWMVILTDRIPWYFRIVRWIRRKINV